MPPRTPADPDQLVIETAPQPTPRKATVPNGSKAPRWSRYDPRKAKVPHRCDACKRLQVDDPSAPIARYARFRRKVAGEPELYLCGWHGNDQRVVDGLPPDKTFTEANRT